MKCYVLLESLSSQRLHMESSSKRIRYNWDRPNTARLINQLKKHELLWNSKHKQYHNKDLREQAYYEILNQLRDVLPEDANTDDLRAKIGCIRTQHNHSVQARERSGKPITFWCYNLLHFLRGEASPPPEVRKAIDKDFAKNEVGKAVWNKANMLTLLEKYKLHTCLWDPSNKFYNTTQVRHKALVDIAKSLSPRTTTREVTVKIYYLRSKYKQILHQLKNEEPAVEPIWWFVYLDFLGPTIEYQTSSSCDKVNQNLSEDISDDASDNEIETTFDSINDANSEIEITTTNILYDEEYVESAIVHADTDNNRFKRLGNHVEDVLNQLSDEKIINDLIDCTHKLLDEAVSYDKLIFHPADIIREFQERQNNENSNNNTLDDKQTFEVKLTFDSQTDNLCIFKAISELPYVNQIQFTKSNFKNAINKIQN